jgi:hypothetical protein
MNLSGTCEAMVSEGMQLCPIAGITSVYCALREFFNHRL